MACVTDGKAQTTRFVVGLILAVVMLGASRADAQPGPGSPATGPVSATMLATQQVARASTEGGGAGPAGERHRARARHRRATAAAPRASWNPPFRPCGRA